MLSLLLHGIFALISVVTKIGLPVKILIPSPIEARHWPNVLENVPSILDTQGPSSKLAVQGWYSRSSKLYKHVKGKEHS
jgi:hypothetical protein